MRKPRLGEPRKLKRRLKKHGIHKKHGALNYEECIKTYEDKKRKKTAMIEEHAKRMAFVDLELNFLSVHADKVRHNSNAERKGNSYGG